MKRITPIRFIKEGAKGRYYEAKINCAKMKIIIADGEDDYPVRVTCQYTGDGGCDANLGAIQRLVTSMLECNVRAEIIINDLNKITCDACKRKLYKDKDKTIALSCARAIAGALNKHITKENGEKKE